MNCTIVKGRFHDELVCTPLVVFGIPVDIKVMISMILITILCLVIRLDKIAIAIFRRIRRPGIQFEVLDADSENTT